MKKTHGIVTLDGQDYETVASRIQKFREAHPKWALLSEIIQINDKNIIMKCCIYDEDAKCIAIGHAEEIRNSSMINTSSALENAETSAWGRALANLGFAGIQIASAEEMRYALKKQKNTNSETIEDNCVYAPEPKKQASKKFGSKTITEKQQAYLKNILRPKRRLPDEFAKEHGFENAASILMDQFNNILEKAKTATFQTPKEIEEEPPPC